MAEQGNQCVKMDRMYGWQRHIYDLTRKFYLLGRDRLLRELPVADGDYVLEVACGTGRNLARLNRQHPGLHLYGLDASRQMLHTAARKLGDMAVLRHSLAESFHYRDTFGLAKPFDCMFLSYGLTMMPCWREALECCLGSLKPGGHFWIIDFWDQAELPPSIQRGLQRWLSAFGVSFNAGMLDHLVEWHNLGLAGVSIESIARRYAFLAQVHSINKNHADYVTDM
jgi:S-adenosylmethionine-diacylgycerolhomoserine-N-methlytransferase